MVIWLFTCPLCYLIQVYQTPEKKGLILHLFKFYYINPPKKLLTNLTKK